MADKQEIDEGDRGSGSSSPAVATPDVLARPSLSVDVALYEHMLADSGMTETQKREFLEALWSIIVAFVDLGFGVHPLQQAARENHGHDHGCGQNGQIGDLSALIAADVLGSVDTKQSSAARSGEAQTAFTGSKEES